MNKKESVQSFPPSISLCNGDLETISNELKDKLNSFSSQFKDVLFELSNELAYNYLANSFGDDEKSNVDYKEILINNSDFRKRQFGITKNDIKSLDEKCLNEIFEDSYKEYSSLGEQFNIRKKLRKSCRNIVIIGAGASFDSYNCIPLGKQMVESFEDFYVKKINGIPFLREKYEQEQNEIKKLTNGLFDFENFLSLLLNFFVKQETLRESIKSHTGFRHPPSLLYEVMAHLLKHSFIDVVINFNFDEILDQTIEEELVKDNYYYVLSDGHSVKIEDLLIGGRLKVPIYIKPHGTFSHKSSLRFTKRHYLDLPIDIKEMLSKLLSGYRGEGKEVERVNLICVGFDLASIEFNDILNEFLPPTSKIYHFLGPNPYVSPNKELPLVKTIEKNLNNFVHKGKELGFSFEKDTYRPIWLFHEGFNNSKLNKVTSPFGEIFTSLWRLTHAKFKDFHKPRSIGRHEIISYLFYNKNDFTNLDRSKVSEKRKLLLNNYDNSPKYYRDRILVELSITLIRSNGVLDIADILKGRIGQYLKKYHAACKAFPNKIREINSIYDLLSEFSKSGFSSETLFDEKEFKYSKNIFELEPLNIDKFPSIIEETIDEVIVNFKEASSKIIANLNEKSNIDAINDYDISNFKAELSSLCNSNSRYFKENPLAVTIILYLLRSDKLSGYFKTSFFYKYNEKIYNGLRWENNEKNMLEEIFRIYSKSNHTNYFHINNQVNGVKQKLWESYKPENMLNTNLSLIHEYKKYFIENGWDCLLTVLETGDIIKEVFDESGSDLKILNEFKNKKLFILLSYEMVFQLHYLKNSDFKRFVDKIDRNSNNLKGEILEELIINHKKYLVSFDSQKKIDEVKKTLLNEIMNNISFVFLPVNEHNNHTTLFLKTTSKNNEVLPNLLQSAINIQPSRNVSDSIQENNKYKEVLGQDNVFDYFYLVNVSYHMYRKGHSKSINPIRLGVKDKFIDDNYIKKDIDKQLLFYFKNLCRGIDFQMQVCPKMTYDEALVVKDFRNWKNWTSDEFYIRMHLFLNNLYKSVRANKNNH